MLGESSTKWISRKKIKVFASFGTNHKPKQTNNKTNKTERENRYHAAQEEQPNTPTRRPETTTWTLIIKTTKFRKVVDTFDRSYFADWTRVESIVDQMLQILAHTHLTLILFEKNVSEKKNKITRKQTNVLDASSDTCNDTCQ